MRTGDLGYLDEDGYLFLVDRSGDVVSSGGHKISTVAVEAALHEHPAVLEAAAFGVPHPVMGQTLAAAVVARPGLRLEALREFLRGSLAEHQIPQRVVMVDTLPRNDNGKVLKAELRQQVMARRRGAADGPRAGAPGPPTPPATGTPTAEVVEQLLLGLWARVLRYGDVRSDDDLVDLGADSVVAAQVAEAARGIGQAVIAELAAHGHEKVCIDVVPTRGRGQGYRRADLRELWQALDALDGVDQVVHPAVELR